jgi:hypothetical protein
VGRGGVEVEGEKVVLDEFGILAQTQNAEADELAVDRLGVEPLLLEDLDSTSGVLLQSGAVDRATDRCVDGICLRVLDPGIEALVSLLNSPDIR